METRTVFLALGTLRCTCGEEFDTKRVQLESVPSKQELDTPDVEAELTSPVYELDMNDRIGFSYTCPQCDEKWEGAVGERENYIFILSVSDSGIIPSQLQKTQLLMDHSEGKRVLDLLEELHMSARILFNHKERFLANADFEPDEMTLEREVNLLADCKAYFAESYSFQKTYKTLIELDFPETARAEKLFEEYKDRSRVVRGLRIYTQKERNPNISFLYDLSEGYIPIIDLAEVEVMDSQVNQHPPDGYKKGSETYYKSIDEDHIKIDQMLIEHTETVDWFIRKLTDSIVDEESEAWNDLMEYRDLQQRFTKELLGISESEDSEECKNS